MVPLLFVVAILLTAVNASAQQAGSGLRISPTRTDLTVEPGAARLITQTVRNVTANAVEVTASINDFESNNISGEPVLLSDTDPQSPRSIKAFVSLPDSFTLQPQEERELQISVNIPAEIAPGAYYGSLVFRAQPEGSTDSGQVVLLASVGSLVLVDIPGEVVEQVEVKSIGAYLNEKSGTFFTEKPDAVGLLVNNLGNGFGVPFGDIDIKNWRGQEVFSIEFNDTQPQQVVLPESERLFFDELNDIESKTVNGEEVIERTSPITWPGRYTISGNISYGQGGEILPVSASFWYLPSWFLITVFVLLSGTITAAVFSHRRHATKRIRSKRKR